MAGHSKWKNIMHKKGKADAQRAKIFTKIAREITIAVKEGGADSSTNARLRDLIAKAKANNVPNDNIDRTITKALGGTSANYDEIVYEGYGPNGVAVIVETTTDNRNRTAGEMRHYFDKYGGNLGTTGSVSFMFKDVGCIIILNENIDNDDLMEKALEVGATDIVEFDEAIEVYTEKLDMLTVRDALIEAGYKIESAEYDKIPSTYVQIEDEEVIKNMNTLLDLLEDNDDVQNVYHNWEN